MSSIDKTEITGGSQKNSESGTKSDGTVIGSSNGSNNYNDNIKKLEAFLVSFSKDGHGEYWPLYLGKNSIGSKSGSNSVFLNEASVSRKHASITIRKHPFNDQMIYELKDLGSSTGTYLNQKDHTEYDDMLLKNEDKIRIGNYSLIFLVVNNRELNMGKEEAFQEKIKDYSDEDYTIA